MQYVRFAMVVILAVVLGRSPAATAGSAGDCHIAAYRLNDGSVVDIGPSEGPELRWRRFDGTTGALRATAGGSWTSSLGWTDRPDGKTVAFSDCAAGQIQFDQRPGKRVEFDVTETVFSGRGVKLAGRLVLPRGNARVPIVVLVHGSESTSARVFYPLQRLLPAEGVGVFVYDKRGTGDSTGTRTFDFSVLADDAVAALAEARRLASPRAGRTGYLGTSQGGWVAPLAASRAAVDFVVVGYGLAVSPIEEDREEIELEMKLKGHGPAVIAKALEVATAGQAVAISGFTDGFARFDEVRARYRGEPWYNDLRGNLTRFLLPSTEPQLRELAKLFGQDASLQYDAMPVLRALKAPQLWILGEDDLDAPSAETSRRLKALAVQGRPIALALFPHADHGILEYEIASSGARVETRYANGYYAMLRDYIRDGRLTGSYGASKITRPPAAR